MCIVFSIIGRVYWCLRITSLSMFVDGSSYVSFLRPFIICIHISYILRVRWVTFLLGALCHCHFHHYIHWWCTSLHVGFERIITPLFVICFTIILVFTFDSSILFHSLSFSYSGLFLGLLLSLHHHYTSHYQFDFLHCLVIVIIFTLGTLGSMTHEIFYTCCISYMRAWVFLSLGFWA